MTFKKLNKTIEYKNPFYSSNNTVPVFIRHKPVVFQIENNMIIKVSKRQFDYLINGNLVTQRCGASKELLENLAKHNVKAGDYDLMFKISKGEV